MSRDLINYVPTIVDSCLRLYDVMLLLQPQRGRSVGNKLSGCMSSVVGTGTGTGSTCPIYVLVFLILLVVIAVVVVVVVVVVLVVLVVVVYR